MGKKRKSKKPSKGQTKISPSPANPTKRVVLSGVDSKKLLATVRIRDRLRTILSRPSAIRYDAVKTKIKGAQVHLKIGKRTLMMLRSPQPPPQPRRIVILRPRPVNRFYLSVLLMILLIGGSGFYTYHLASSWYESSTFSLTTSQEWQSWVKKVSGKKTAFSPSKERSLALNEERHSLEKRVRHSQKPKLSKRAKSNTNKVVKASKSAKKKKTAKIRKKQATPMAKLKKWYKDRVPDVQSVSYSKD